MKALQSKYPEKNIIVSQSQDIIPAFATPNLSVILTKIINIWQERNVHIFIDEFNGSYFDRAEVMKVWKLLHRFDKCHIVVAVQSMEEDVSMNNIEESVDFGYQFDLLTKKTSFVIYKLEHSLRSSYEINEFIKATASVIGSAEIKSYSSTQNYHSSGKFIDKEFGMTNFERNSAREESSPMNLRRSYNFNQSDKIAHNVKTGPVDVYFIDKTTLTNLNDQSSAYVSVLEYILNYESERDTFVVCTYDKELYNSVFGFLERCFSYKWTNVIYDFIKQKSPFKLLLTDYASVRGFEFQNFIFFAPLGSKHLKYRIIECLARATTKLIEITDNAKMSKYFASKNDSIDVKLLKLWKKLQCSEFYEVKYKKSSDTINALKDEDVFVIKEDVSKLRYKVCDKFPWGKGVSLQSCYEENEGVLAVMKNLLLTDNIELCREFLITNNISFCTFDNTQKLNLLLSAIVYNGMKIMHLLIDEYNFQIHRKDKSYPSLLKAAVQHKNADAIQLLSERHSFVSESFKPINVLSSRIYLNELNMIGNTILYESVYNGYMDLSIRLIDIGADINVKNIDKNTPLHAAALNGYDSIARIIIDKGADVNIQNEHGNTPLHIAISHDSIWISKMILDKNVNVNIQNNNGNTFLHEAVSNGCGSVVKILVAKAADMNIRNINGNTPLHISTFSGNFDISDMLVCNGADINLQNYTENTPLHNASLGCHTSIVKLLINRNADINIRNIGGDTPFLIASLRGSEICKPFIDNFRAINECNTSGSTALHNAAMKGFLDIVRLLIDRGVDVNTLNNYSSTPLHKAAYNGHVNVVKLLLDEGADVNIENTNGSTPLLLAVKNNHTDIVNLLLSKKHNFDFRDVMAGYLSDVLQVEKYSPFTKS